MTKEKALADVIGKDAMEVLDAMGVIVIPVEVPAPDLQQDVKDLLPLRLRRSGGALAEDYEERYENWEANDDAGR